MKKLALKPTVHDRLLAPAAVARRMDVHAETVRGWIRRGLIPAIRLPNGYYRITSSTLSQLLSDEIKVTE